MGLSWW